MKPKIFELHDESQESVQIPHVSLPQLGLDVGMECLYRGTWSEAHKFLQQNQVRMLTLSEYVTLYDQALKERDNGNNSLYHILLHPHDEYQGEFLDARFVIENEIVIMMSDHQLEDGILRETQKQILEGDWRGTENPKKAIIDNPPYISGEKVMLLPASFTGLPMQYAKQESNDSWEYIRPRWQDIHSAHDSQTICAVFSGHRSSYSMYRQQLNCAGNSGFHWPTLKVRPVRSHKEK